MLRSRPTEQTVNEFVDLLGGTDLLRPRIPNHQRNNTTQVDKNLTKINIDIVNEEKYFYIYSELPSVKRENIDIKFNSNKITIFAEKTRLYENAEMSEIKYGKFERQITLPFCITKKESVEVNYTDGMLKIKINKHLEEGNTFTIKP